MNTVASRFFKAQAKLSTYKPVQQQKLHSQPKQDTVELRFKGAPNIMREINAMPQSSFKNTLGRKVSERMAAWTDYRLFKKFVQESTDFHNVRKAENAARKRFGVVANYGDNHYASQLANGALEDLYGKGFCMPKEVNVIDFSVFNNPNGTVTSQDLVNNTGTLIPLTGSIFLNSSVKWGSFRPELEQMRELGTISTANPKHFIWGLMCENLIDTTNHEMFKKLYKRSLGFEDAAYLKHNVSELASESALFAVKELFAKMMDGKELNSIEKRIYRKFHGPQPQA